MIFLIILTLCRLTHLCTYVAYLLYLPRHSLYWKDLHQASGSHHFSTVISADNDGPTPRDAAPPDQRDGAGGYVPTPLWYDHPVW